MRYEADMALIRHGMTPGNEEHRYIGRTDEPLSQKGREQLLTLQKKGVYPAAACVAASPLERCRQTAELNSETFVVIIDNTPFQKTSCRKEAPL